MESWYSTRSWLECAVDLTLPVSSHDVVIRPKFPGYQITTGPRCVQYDYPTSISPVLSSTLTSAFPPSPSGIKEAQLIQLRSSLKASAVLNSHTDGPMRVSEIEKALIQWGSWPIRFGSVTGSWSVLSSDNHLTWCVAIAAKFYHWILRLQQLVIQDLLRWVSSILVCCLAWICADGLVPHGFGLSMEAVMPSAGSSYRLRLTAKRRSSASHVSLQIMLIHGYESSAHWGMLRLYPRRLRSFVSVFHTHSKVSCRLRNCTNIPIFVVQGWWSLKGGHPAKEKSRSMSMG